ncbi:hypothetical protein [Streptomyces collinus]|uniref:hypothetical protein n=1 Tax=Streptomyces collinus TaxID=42684 RepID=UPI0029424878|nr:hypothetical protein [Streptomyces collinus]
MDHPFVIEQSRELRDLAADFAHRLAWFVSPADEPHCIDLLLLIQLLLWMGDFTTIDASPLDGSGPNL